MLQSLTDSIKRRKNTLYHPTFRPQDFQHEGATQQMLNLCVCVGTDITTHTHTQSVQPLAFLIKPPQIPESQVSCWQAGASTQIHMRLSFFGGDVSNQIQLAIQRISTAWTLFVRHSSEMLKTCQKTNTTLAVRERYKHTVSATGSARPNFNCQISISPEESF